MNEDYLWDKSGEADPDIKQLEERLGQLRFKRPAAPLPLPAEPSTRSFRLSTYTPALAIAASLLLLILAGGLWMSLRRPASTEGEKGLATGKASEEKQTQQIVSGPRPPLDPVKPITGDMAQAESVPASASPSSAARVNRTPRRSTAPRQLMARLDGPGTESRTTNRALAREGEQAKAQLIMALQITSQKLNTVQKKVQTHQERSPIS
ncbi:MAG TPA: hypothetical protein VJT09_01995 [Pyrinomonadaceae bacterium]|nr:hypothetical protein [Pyrinomonadaceae bacterium]